MPPTKKHGSVRRTSSPPVRAETDSGILLSADLHGELKMYAGLVKTWADKMYKMLPDINRKRKKGERSKQLPRLEEKYSELKGDLLDATNELKALQGTTEERYGRVPTMGGSMIVDPKSAKRKRESQPVASTSGLAAEAGFDTPDKSGCVECLMWKKKHDKLQQELDRAKETISTLERETDEIKRSKKDLNHNLSAAKKDLQHVLDSYVPRTEMLSWKEKYQAEYEERETAMMRLSEMASSQLRDNNPNIADLSDVNRPTKLGEKMSELYDNAWTNAYDEFENVGMEENAIIKCLLDVLMTIYHACKRRSSGSYFKDVQHCIEQSEPDGKLDGEMTPQLRQQIKEFRKARAPKVIPTIQRSILRNVPNTSKQPYTKQAVREYMQECVELCWYMVVQDPPVILKADIGPAFDSKALKEYTQRGKYVEFMCWPATYLHEGGAMLCKGVAQGCNEIPASAQPGGSQPLRSSGGSARSAGPSMSPRWSPPRSPNGIESQMSSRSTPPRSPSGMEGQMSYRSSSRSPNAMEGQMSYTSSGSTSPRAYQQGQMGRSYRSDVKAPGGTENKRTRQGTRQQQGRMAQHHTPAAGTDV